MKIFFVTTMTVVFMLCYTIGIQAQTTQTKLNPVNLDNTQQFSIASNYVAGENYIIQVGLPFDYSSSFKSYPVVYVLDGDMLFGLTKGIADILMFGKEIKDIIIIGIGYGKGTDIWIKNRSRDFTPSIDTFIVNGKLMKTGGADNFLKFIHNELFSVVNKNYRTNPDSCAIIGLSLGGLLSSYILFKQPELFNSYIIGSPAVFWSNRSILKLESEYFSNHKQLNSTVYMAYGSLEDEDYTNPIDEFIKNIQARKYQELKLVTRIFEDETHMSVPSVSITNGLRTIFIP
jgi:uncharacterized protein